MTYDTRPRRSAGTWGRRVLYWLAVIVISIALVVALLVLLQSQDDATVGAITIGRV